VAELTLLTLVFEFLSPLIVTVVYLVLFSNRSNKFIEAFIVLMYVKTITFFLFWILSIDVSVVPGFDSAVGANGLIWMLITDFVFQFTTTLQEYLTWVMVSFFAVLFGMIVLALKLTLQDPLQKRFSRLRRRNEWDAAESDGYAGLRDRLENITFEGVEPQPLDPDVQSRTWRDAWKDYLIIGLATIIPSVFVYNGGIVTWIMFNAGHPAYEVPPGYLYILGVFIFLTWIYRFGYPASNRIAKSAGLKLGDRDLGGEMMRGVLGWFFRLNVLLSIGLILFEVTRALSAPILINPGPGWSGLSEAQLHELVFNYFLSGVIQASPPILFAIIILPITENFAVSLYKKAFDRIAGVRHRVSEAAEGDMLETLVGAVATGFAVTGAFIAAVMAVTLTCAHALGLPGFRFMPGQVDPDITSILTNALNNETLITPTIWILLMLAIPFAMMLLLGVMGHFVRARIGGSLEAFALVAGLTVSILTWFSLPGVDYVLNVRPTPAVVEGVTIHHLRPIITPPEPGMLLYRLAFQFIVNVPIYIFTVLFVLYFFEFRGRWREQTGDVSGPLLNVRTEDIRQAVMMFFGGLLASIIGIWLLIMFNDPGFVWTNLFGLFADIGNPNGLERVFEFFVRDELETFFWLFAEHNFVRTLLMMVIGPIFWSAVLWLFAVKYKSKGIAYGSTAAVIITGIAAVVWTQVDLVSGVFVPASPLDEVNPWVLSAHLGYRAAILYGILVGAFILITLARVLGKGGTGSWWFPLFVSIFALEYFIFDDQFTLIALVILPLIIAAVYRVAYRSRLEVRDEDFILTYIRFSLMSVAIAEVLSTAMIVGGVALWESMDAGNVLPAIARIAPHAIVEIPAFLMAAAVSFRIAKDLGPSITNEDWDSVPAKTRALISDSRTWRTFALIIFFLLLGALIEAYVTDIVYWWVRFGVPPP
jgi:uncharacterized membrane protein SpoIIM required for sporulation